MSDKELMSDEELIGMAYDLIVEKSLSLSEAEYLKIREHVTTVYLILTMVTKDINIIVAGLLHDIIEDTDCTHDELIELFGKRIADLVYEVTHEGHKDEHGYYFPRLKSKEAIMIKFADRLHNLSRIDEWPKERQDQYLRKSKFWRSEINK